MQGGCHSNEKFACLGGMGTLFTAVFTYFGFSLLLWGSLWNANLIQKLGKAKDQWNQLRGNGQAGGASKQMAAPTASSARGSVASISSDAEFKRLLGSGSAVIVQFTASWCNPCKQIAPVFADLSAQYSASSGISFLKLDVDECESSAAGVSSMPTFKFYKGGKEIDSMAGADQAKLSLFVQKCAGGAAGSTDLEASVAVAADAGECTT
jgi:thiol-disulfide isomerase/thioredoxin